MASVKAAMAGLTLRICFAAPTADTNRLGRVDAQRTRGTGTYPYLRRDVTAGSAPRNGTRSQRHLSQRTKERRHARGSGFVDMDEGGTAGWRRCDLV